MIAMRMRDENVSYRLARKRVAKCIEMRRIVRSGIDHGDASLSDDGDAGALESERPGIVGQQTANARTDRNQLFVRGFERAVERDTHARRDRSPMSCLMYHGIFKCCLWERWISTCRPPARLFITAQKFQQAAAG